MGARLHAVIVTYNPDLAGFTQVLASLARQVEHVSIIDNGSANIQALETLAVAHAARLTRFPENRGIAAAQNQGIADAAAQSADYVLLMDQDTVLPDGTAASLLQDSIDLANQGVRIGAVGCAYRDTHDGRLTQIWRARGLLLRRQRVHPGDPRLQEVDCVIASGSLIPMATLRAVGDMEADLFIDLVDIEWGLRAKSLGYRSFVSFNRIMSHTLGNGRLKLFGKTISVHSPIRNYYSIRNSIMLAQRRYIGIAWRLYFIRRIIPYFIVFGLFGGQTKSRLRMMARGLLDSLRARTGGLGR